MQQIRCYKAKAKPFLSNKRIKGRSEFCDKYENIDLKKYRRFSLAKIKQNFWNFKDEKDFMNFWQTKIIWKYCQLLLLKKAVTFLKGRAALILQSYSPVSFI